MKLFQLVRMLSSTLPEVNDAVNGTESAGWLEMIKQMIADADLMRFVDSLR